MTSFPELERLIPAGLAPRVRSLRLVSGVATVVVDASDLERGEAEAMQRALEHTLQQSEEVREVRVALTADREMKPQRRIIAIGSGKGGVGKSTLTANLAVALARMGRRVGVVDADIYGPSQPMLLGAADARPEAEGKQLIPVESPSGVRMLSMGQLVPADKAIAWRGPMVAGALTQMMEARWDGTDLLLVDLPPGTGDVQLTMLQKFRPTGAVVVSTPQDLALIDARRALDLFRQAGVPVIGLVENMAGYACPHCGEVSDPFGAGGAEAAARELGEAFLGRVPLMMAIRSASDAGQPPAGGEAAEGAPFATIAAALADWLDRDAAGT